MSRHYSAFYASVAALLVIATAPVAAQAHAQHHAVRMTRAEQTAKTSVTHSAKDQDRRQRATTPVLKRNTLVSVGPQASAFRRIRDIAMAPVG